VNDVIVIGAGMAGVTAARQLASEGVSVCVVEGRDRLGGRIHSIRDFCDRPVEGGAEFVHGVGAATWPEIRAAGLEARPCPVMRHTMFNIGGRTRWLPWILLHPGVWPAFTIMRAISRFRPPDLSAAEFLKRQGYEGRARVLARMVLSAHLPGGVDEIGLQGLVEDGVLHLEKGLNHRISAGYDSLPAFIARGLDVRFGFAVEQLVWNRDGVTVRSRDGRELSSRAAISTLPVGVLKSGAVKFLPELPASKRSALERIEMGPVLKILLRFENCFWPKWAAIVGCGEGPATLYWPLSYGAGEGVPVLIAYATGPRAARLSALEEEEAVDVVLADLSRLFPKADPRGALIARRRVDWGADPYSCGGYTFLRPGGAGARELLAAPDTPPLFWAGSASAWSPIAATVEAAYTSGRRAAREAIEYLSGSCADR